VWSGEKEESGKEGVSRGRGQERRGDAKRRVRRGKGGVREGGKEAWVGRGTRGAMRKAVEKSEMWVWNGRGLCCSPLPPHPAPLQRPGAA
jgi:hypothetical protein